MNTTERWLDCQGYEGFYRVSDQGRVLNLRRQKFLQGTVTNGGYRQVKLTRPDKPARSVLVHALVLTAFVGPRPPGLVCDHMSGVKLDNAVINLEWVTPKENSRRAARAGLLRHNPVRGRDHYCAVLNENKVRAIRKRRERGVPVGVLAREYGVTPTAIGKVLTRRSWKHVA